MSRSIFLLCARVGPGAGGLTLLLWAPFARPAPRTDVATATVLAVVAGLAVFAVLARRCLPPPLTRRPVACGVALALPAVLLGAIEEEAVWRYAAFAALQPELGAAATLALSTAGFALVHVRALGVRALRSHLLTGVVFGGVYLATGRISAAILTHAVYNVLVVAGSLAWRPPLEQLEARL
jgi:membrane protease YdiL (CAAX protease family)